ncbi:MAG: DUF4292 domain-containing protein [Ignavibacteriales bacterium]|nr:DUF4292 domain-containing protein [Ignavibacteriales bacterium]
MKKILLISISAILLFLVGCTATKPLEEEQTISAERIVKRLEANRRKIKSFVGKGTIFVITKELNTRSSFQVEIKRPDSLKVSFFGPFGIDLAYSLISQKDFQFYDVINNKYYKGKVRPGIIKDLMKINVPYDELMDAVTGSVNLTSKLRIEPVANQKDDGTYELIYSDSTNSIVSTIIIDASNLRIIRYLISDMRGKVSYQADYDGFRKVDDVYLPFNISINDKANDQKLRVEYRSVELNKLTEKLKLDIPDDAKVTDL